MKLHYGVTTGRPWLSRLLICAVLAAPLSIAGGQSSLPATMTPVRSMGQPPTWMPYVGLSSVFGRRDADPGGTLMLGVHRPVGSPIVGFGVDGEVYGTAGGAEATGGIRLLASARVVNLRAGLDWDAGAGNSVFLLSWDTAVRRGGLFGHGSTVRLDWLPARSQTIAVGVTVPLAQPNAGITRPRNTGVTIAPYRLATTRPKPFESSSEASVTPRSLAVDSALAAVREAAVLIRLYTNAFVDDDAPGLAMSRRASRRTAERVRDSLVAMSPRYPNGRNFADVQHVYQSQLAHMFAMASGSDTTLGERIGRRARAGLLDHVIIPFDTLFGRVKNNQYDIEPLTSAAEQSFRGWLIDSSSVSEERRGDVLGAHRRWLQVIALLQMELADQWEDSRRVWLPLQLAITPEDHDEQAEMDALMARAAGRPFTNGNGMTYLRSTDLPLEFARSVTLARDYHVLWIHDFTGRRPTGEIDRVSFGEVADVYFPALTRAVQRYDSTGVLPTYLIFLDQNFYEASDGRLWMTMLESPLDASLSLPGNNAPAEGYLRQRQQELRDAVAASSRLQADASRNGGAKWIARMVKVHVNITQPSDFTFRSHRIIPPLPFLPDNLMRDHRKLAFYDLTEADPYRGAMIIGGVGIGAQYSSPTWDDRGMSLRGPVALETRAAARRLLLLNGFSSNEIPPVLRESSASELSAARRNTSEIELPDDGQTYTARALQVHNEPGFGRKQSSVLRAMLYSLAPSGSIIVVPDPLWLGSEWAGMLVGAALRGVRVFIIAPSLANAPSSAAPTMSEASDVLGRLIQVGQVYGKQIEQAGGELRVGIYSATEDVNDIVAQAREVRAGLDRAPWLRELVPFDSATLAVLDEVPALLHSAGYSPVAPGRDVTPRLPQLHMKEQLVADEATLAELARQPQWPEILGRLLVARARQTSADADPRGVAAAVAEAGLAEPAEALVKGFEATRTAEQRRHVNYYLALGTQNHDSRGLMLDGEATVIISGPEAASALVDFYFLMARSTWVTTLDELDTHIPPADGLIRRLARFMRFVL